MSVTAGGGSTEGPLDVTHNLDMELFPNWSTLLYSLRTTSCIKGKKKCFSWTNRYFCCYLLCKKVLKVTNTWKGELSVSFPVNICVALFSILSLFLKVVKCEKHNLVYEENVIQHNQNLAIWFIFHFRHTFQHRQWHLELYSTRRPWSKSFWEQTMLISIGPGLGP